ncbi:D-tyrosyl-tRNA(Tyr) deacylase [Tamilnaduibacter salinus]|uniref:D-aminoacyl-tRNA deacylase n=1 Tax=Tamilnaduibacter salinus TaxID=1484056 RepID=A0A2U1CU07_9GAMM|nr:D-aminoacyl-tRNA deacylase [Tamilnaduibacter salinus]PVY70331.1 D-tyrosyl-tRNA(Tyr) deacylase [Tamilnaduibacter salinus]
MKGLIQRVTRACVQVEEETVGRIGPGLLLFLGVEKGDSEVQVERLCQRVLRYRVFPDGKGRMNCSLLDSGGALLVVPQFTLAADTQRGNRPSFSPAAPPEDGERCFGQFLTSAREVLGVDRVSAGRFGADMAVSLENDGPVTFLLQG